jgi:hypothetical protein
MKANKASIKGAAAGAGASTASDTVDTDVPHDIVTTRTIAAEITTRGAKLYDLLRDEQTLRDARAKVRAWGCIGKRCSVTEVWSVVFGWWVG